jgi:hypothetical protein
MALSVLKPGGAIHPVVGSIFSTPRPDASFESSGEVAIVPSGDRREFLANAVSQTAFSSPSARRLRGAVDAIEGELPAKSIPTMQSAAVSTPASTTRADSEGSSSERPRNSNQFDGRVESAASVAESATTSEKRTYVPLITATPSAPPASFGSSRKPEAESSQPLVSRSRATDDIEIHIGRIEVAAVHPAPTRTAPVKPQRRAASLDEYLKRRDGRSS